MFWMIGVLLTAALLAEPKAIPQLQLGASLTFDGPRTIDPDKPLRLRYGLFIHAGAPALDEIDKRWKEFYELKLPEMVGSAHPTEEVKKK